MAASRITASLLLRTSRSSVTRAPRQSWPSVRLNALCAPIAIHLSQSRGYSQDAPPPNKIYSFEDVKVLSEKPSPSRILIDTREPTELQSTGTIPNSLNVPVTSQPDSWFISPEEFEDRYGFQRPGKDVEVVFFCKAGVRSRAAAELAKQAGWGNVAEYKGSWMDWDARGGTKEGGRS